MNKIKPFIFQEKMGAASGKHNIILSFNGTRLGVAENVPRKFCCVPEIDVSVFLRKNVRLEFIDKLCAKLIVTCYVSWEEWGNAPLSKNEDLPLYLDNLKDRVSDRDICLVARILNAEYFTFEEGGTCRLDQISLPYLIQFR
jgi:hypothetical protein